MTGLERLAGLVRDRYVPDSPTHDHTHLARVAALATRICAVEGGSQLIAGSAAWLHDLHREKRTGGPYFVPPDAMDDRARALLAEADIDEGIWDRILEAIHYTDRFSFSDRPVYHAPIEARAVRDADMLDAIGAIGVARAFSFGGAHHIPLWTGMAPTDPGTFMQSRRPRSTIDHFHEKLLRLSAELETPTAIEIGRGRDAYLRNFIDEFVGEWQSDLTGDGDEAGGTAT